MKIMNTGAIILAAGDGKRMKSSRPKVMCEVLEKPMIGWVIDSLCEADFKAESIGVVVGNGAEIVSEYVNSRSITRTFMQTERKGTGHAVMQAAEMLDLCDNVLVLCGDAPFIDSETITKSLEAHISSDSKVTVVTAEIENPTGYGRIIRDENG
ncbi:MAG: NTP transferase domain-containing protein, partial [Oscillospiraceae bacterium]|nr:NTP transferase domain-containing protein [Oscillospiraceae bacterium]